MKDPKYGVVQVGNPTPSMANPDEPCFVLRGQDMLAPLAVRAYADAVEATVGGQAGKNRAARIREIADRMAAWTPRKLPD